MKQIEYVLMQALKPSVARHSPTPPAKWGKFFVLGAEDFKTMSARAMKEAERAPASATAKALEDLEFAVVDGGYWLIGANKADITRITSDFIVRGDAIWISILAYDEMRRKSWPWLTSAHRQFGFKAIAPVNNAYEPLRTDTTSHEIREYKRGLAEGLDSPRMAVLEEFCDYDGLIRKTV